MAEKTTKKLKMPGELPHSLEAEQSILGCLLLDTRMQVEVAAFLHEDDFVSEAHKIIFNAMNEIILQNKPVDIVTLSDLLEKKGELKAVGGIEYLTELISVIPSAANYQHYLDIVHRDSMLRKLILGATEIIQESIGSSDSNTSLAFAEKTVFDISDKADTSSLVKIGNILPDVMMMLNELGDENSIHHGLKTGYRELDRVLGGLRPGNLIVLAARPGCGKTSFGMNIVENLAKQGHTCAVFSLEMSKEELAQRMICSVAEVNSQHVKTGKIDRTEWRKIRKAQEILAPSKIYIEESAGSNPHEILSKCRRLKRKSGLDFVLIDYIQLMESSNPNRKKEGRQQEVSDISRNLKILAKELKVPVLALSQLSRDSAKRKEKPQLQDLRDSGAIEQDADIVMFIHRPDQYASEKDIEEGKIKKNVVEILVEKNRHGSQAHFDLYFKGECTKFKDINTDGTVNGEDVKPIETDKPIAVEEIASDGETITANVKSIDDEMFGG